MNLDNSSRGRDERKNAMYSTMSLSNYITTWLETFKDGSVKQATYHRLATSLTALLHDSLSEMPICDITALDIQAYINRLTEQGYGISTIKKQMQIVISPLRQAAAMHLIQADPSAGVKLPSETRLKKKTKSVEPYTEEEQKRIWEVVDRSDHLAIIGVGVLLETGLRAGELIALRWEDVDIPRKRLRVSGTIINPNASSTSVYQSGAKSKASNRIVPLTPKAIELLEKCKGRNDTWVFAGRGGRWLSYNNLMKHIKQVCKNAHVPYRGAHAFRHTFATNCYYKGVDVKVLSKLLGHSDIGVTMNIYVSLRGDGFDEMYAALVG